MLYYLTFPLVKRIMHLVFLYLGGFRSAGAENVPRGGGVLICPNHVSDADPCAIAVSLPRNAHYMAKAELFDIPVLGALIRHWRGFPVNPNSADRGALRHAEKLLRAGEAVVIFPEGGGNAENTLQALHPGALLLALRCQVPVVPVALVNTGLVWPNGTLWPHRAPATVSVMYGKPLDLTGIKGKRGAVETATARLTETLAGMLGQPIPDLKTREPVVHRRTTASSPDGLGHAVSRRVIVAK